MKKPIEYEPIDMDEVGVPQSSQDERPAAFLEDCEDLDPEQLELKLQEDMSKLLREMRHFFSSLSDEDLDDDDVLFEIEDLTQNFSTLRYREHGYEEFESQRRAEEKQEYVDLAHLKKEVLLAFSLPDGCPDLPFQPEGTLFGIGIGYDEDRDDRVIVAAAKLSNFYAKQNGYCVYKNAEDIVAVYEHEGELHVYTLNPVIENFSGGMRDIEVCGDTWSITQHVPRGPMGWVAVTPDYVHFCVRSLLEKERRGFAGEHEGATQKQVNYLRGLGYSGSSQITKAEASRLIQTLKKN